jgi:gamma-glutamyltranspeptidase
MKKEMLLMRLATELALACYPYAGNIGGGGFMVYRKANGDWYDYREKAISSFKDMFLDDKGNVIPGKVTTALAMEFLALSLVFCCS